MKRFRLGVVACTVLLAFGLGIIFARGVVSATEASVSAEIDSTPNSTITAPLKLAIYYGWPSLVNDAAGDVAVASAEFAQFDIVVLGDGLEHPTHGDHAKTTQIISTIETSGTQVFGYIDMGISTQNLPIISATQYVDEWNAMGVTGIFWDDYGFDFGVDRARQTTLISYTHAQSLTAFVNAWVPEDVFEMSDGITTPLKAGDWYLSESSPIVNGAFQDLDFWWSKSQKLANYNTTFGINIAAVAMGSDGYTGWANQPEYRQSLWAAYLFGWQAFGWTNSQFSASGSSANEINSPPDLATDVGTTYLSAPTMVSSTMYTRTTNTGTMVVYGNSSDGGGTYYGGPCNTQMMGTVIWPDCHTTPQPHSSPYGPRQKGSEDRRYDWHRGGDIPQPLGAPVYAMMDGVVRIGGSHPAYSDGVIQLRHRERSPYLYSNVLHMLTSTVKDGDVVTVGDLVGYSGESESGFDHMHIEFREGCLNQNCNRNPWGYLPYTDAAPSAPTLLGASLGTNDKLLLKTSTPFDQLDADGLALDWGSTYTVGFEALNALTDPDNPHFHDFGVYDVGGVDVCILPARFTTGYASADFEFAFLNLPATGSGTAQSLDLHTQSAATLLNPDLPQLTLSPPSITRSVPPGSPVSIAYTLSNNSGASLPISITARSAQNNPISVSPSEVTLAAEASVSVTFVVTTSAEFPAGIGDCILLEVDGGTAHKLISTQVIGSSAVPTSVVEMGEMSLRPTSPQWFILLPVLLVVATLVLWRTSRAKLQK